MTDAILFTATASFQAARQVSGLPHGHRAARRHGHGFRVKIHADLPARPERPAGTEARALGEHLQGVVDTLDYRDLNDLLEQPGDFALAAWLGERLAGVARAERISALSLSATDWRGVVIAAEQDPRCWRRYRFEAAHRLPKVPAEHPCGRMHGHGFEVILHASPEPGDGTGLLTHDRLDALWAPCFGQLHHGCLNDLPGLENPTSELLCLWLWRRLRPALPGLRHVTVRETGTAGACYDGKRFRIWKDSFFESAARFVGLPAADPWQALHGHSHALRLMLTAPLDDVLGWTVDFGDVKALFKPVYAELDHHDLTALSGLERPGPAELLRWIHARVSPVLPALDGLELNPTPGSGAVLILARPDGDTDRHADANADANASASASASAEASAEASVDHRANADEGPGIGSGKGPDNSLDNRPKAEPDLTPVLALPAL